MKTETKQAIEAHTLKLAVVYLLAQEAKRSPKGLDILHETMVQHFMDATRLAGQDHPRDALALEVAMTNSIDELIALVRPLVQK